MRIATHFHHRANRKRDNERMTRREQDVLQLLLQGKANKAIALELRISEYTVRGHVSSLLRNAE